jgi:hypothetical protein
MDEQKAMVRTGLCPVCGFELADGVREFSLCPSCGTEFGYSDAATSHEELRVRWVSLGGPWSGRPELRPLRWDPVQQLEAAGLDAAANRLRADLAGTGLSAASAFR